jgi:hypothetical protein
MVSVRRLCQMQGKGPDEILAGAEREGHTVYRLRRGSTLRFFVLPQSASVDRSTYRVEHTPMAMVQEAVEDGGGYHRIPEDLAPFAYTAIAGHQEAAPLIAPRDELEEEMRGVGLEGQIAELIDDQELRLGEVAQPLLDPIIEVGLGEARHERGRRDKEHRVAVVDHLTAQGHR